MKQGNVRQEGVEPFRAVADLIASHGARPHPIQAVLARLCRGWVPFDELIRDTGCPRRAVERLLTALGDDLERNGEAARIIPAAQDSYATLSEPDARPLADPLDDLVCEHTELLAELTSLIDEVPAPVTALDHVQATPKTVLRRALWMSATYELADAKIVFLGDHDLTSLAVRALHPRAQLTVVDLDERLLGFLDRQADGTIRLLFSDLRFGLPGAAAGHADLVFSDPPYTPEGMGLFAARGVESLADPTHGRLLLAYGYSSLHPTLGAQVQRELLNQGLIFEAVLPAFHRYFGAQAIGSAADLYVCRATPAARKRGGAGKGKRARTGIYTHGPQSVEAASSPSPLRDALTDVAQQGGRRLDGEVRGPDWTVPLAGLEDATLAYDLAPDPGPWLLRLLLARNTGRIALLVGNNHPDLVNAARQKELRELIAAKYQLRLLRSTPDNRHAVVVADRTPLDQLDRSSRARNTVLGKAHGKLGNILRDALIERAGGEVTKNEAREQVAELVQRNGIRPHELDLRLIDLPRHRIQAALNALA